MPIADYGVLKGRPVNRRLGTAANAHYQVHIVDDTTDYRIAVNVKSKLHPSEVEYLIDENFQHPITAELVNLPSGFKPLQSSPGGLAIDYIRSNLFDPTQMKPLPFNLPGSDNDLNEKIDKYITRALSDETANIYAFGERWGPESNKKDKIFGFLPGNGIHDIHMNQGNVGQFIKDDGVYQDGALLIHYPIENQWVAVFLKFQSQTWHTDDRTGHRDDSAPHPVPPTREDVPVPVQAQASVRIVAAVVNPIASSPETVTLINASAQAVQLDEWKLANRQKAKFSLSGTIEPGATIAVPLSNEMRLSDKGDIITLLNPQGLKVDGVAFTKHQTVQQGWTIVF